MSSVAEAAEHCTFSTCSSADGHHRRRRPCSILSAPCLSSRIITKHYICMCRLCCCVSTIADMKARTDPPPLPIIASALSHDERIIAYMHVSSVALRWHCRRHTRHGHMPPPPRNTAPALSHDFICTCRLWRCVGTVADVQGTGTCSLRLLTPHLHSRAVCGSAFAPSQTLQGMGRCPSTLQQHICTVSSVSYSSGNKHSAAVSPQLYPHSESAEEQHQ